MRYELYSLTPEVIRKVESLSFSLRVTSKWLLLRVTNWTEGRKCIGKFLHKMMNTGQWHTTVSNTRERRKRHGRRLTVVQFTTVGLLFCFFLLLSHLAFILKLVERKQESLTGVKLKAPFSCLLRVTYQNHFCYSVSFLCTCITTVLAFW